MCMHADILTACMRLAHLIITLNPVHDCIARCLDGVFVNQICLGKNYNTTRYNTPWGFDELALVKISWTGTLDE